MMLSPCHTLLVLAASTALLPSPSQGLKMFGGGGPPDGICGAGMQIPLARCAVLANHLTQSKGAAEALRNVPGELQRQRELGGFGQPFDNSSALGVWTTPGPAPIGKRMGEALRDHCNLPPMNSNLKLSKDFYEGTIIGKPTYWKDTTGAAAVPTHAPTARGGGAALLVSSGRSTAHHSRGARAWDKPPSMEAAWARATDSSFPQNSRDPLFCKESASSGCDLRGCDLQKAWDPLFEEAIFAPTSFLQKAWGPLSEEAIFAPTRDFDISRDSAHQFISTHAVPTHAETGAAVPTHAAPLGGPRPRPRGSPTVVPPPLNLNDAEKAWEDGSLGKASMEAAWARATSENGKFPNPSSNHFKKREADGSLQKAWSLSRNPVSNNALYGSDRSGSPEGVLLTRAHQLFTQESSNARAAEVDVKQGSGFSTPAAQQKPVVVPFVSDHRDFCLKATTIDLDFDVTTSDSEIANLILKDTIEAELERRFGPRMVEVKKCMANGKPTMTFSVYVGGEVASMKVRLYKALRGRRQTGPQRVHVEVGRQNGKQRRDLRRFEKTGFAVACAVLHCESRTQQSDHLR